MKLITQEFLTGERALFQASAACPEARVKDGLERLKKGIMAYEC